MTQDIKSIEDQVCDIVEWNNLSAREQYQLMSRLTDRFRVAYEESGEDEEKVALEALPATSRAPEQTELAKFMAERQGKPYRSVIVAEPDFDF